METIRIEDLIQRWSLKNRQAVHARFKQLRTKGVNIEPVAPGLYNAELLPLLDRYHEFLKGGGNINFFELDVTDVEFIDVNSQLSATPTSQQDAGYITIEQASKLIGTIATVIKAPGLESLEWLEKAALNNWQLSTFQICGLIGTKPRTRDELPFVWGSFYFVQVGKIGRQYAWAVRKLNPTTTKPKLAALPALREEHEISNTC